MPKISVIVPVYKAEAYLRRCVDSLLAQTFQDFELLLVDDGSPDRSGAICDEYAQQDSRVRVFHKENGGVSSARQCGLDNAHGDYTIHADPDDWVEPDMLEALYAKATAEEADMVICDFYIERNGHQTYRKQQPTSLDHETVLRELFQQLHGSCCNKLVKRACYNAYGVRFPEDFSFCEDLYVNASLLKHKLRVNYLNKAFYHYSTNENTNSIVQKYNIEIQKQDFLLFSSINKLLKSTSVYITARSHMAYLITIRAFQAKTESSRSFYKKFHRLSRYINQNKNISPFLKFILISSSIGTYAISYRLYHLTMNAHRNIKSLY